MKISVLKVSRKKEVIKRIELSEVAEMIRKSPEVVGSGREPIYRLDAH